MHGLSIGKCRSTAPQMLEQHALLPQADPPTVATDVVEGLVQVVASSAQEPQEVDSKPASEQPTLSPGSVAANVSFMTAATVDVSSPNISGTTPASERLVSCTAQHCYFAQTNKLHFAVAVA